MFSLDKLKVYDKALTNAASLAQRSQSWDKQHAVTDQLLRASESFVLNLAEGARLRSSAKGSISSTRQLRQVDHAGTSLVLNIAEANGRYAPGERRSLFEIAESAAVRLGTYLELCTRTDKLDHEQKACAMALLDRIALMLRGLRSG
jgi:four helix bundle protein